jgi:hypothetical protein
MSKLIAIIIDISVTFELRSLLDRVDSVLYPEQWREVVSRERRLAW